MNSKETKIIVVSEDETNIRQLSFSIKRILIGVLIFLVTMFFSGRYAVDFLFDFTQNSKIETLKRNNEFLKSRLDEMGKAVAEMSAQMEDIEKKDDDLRTIMGIKKLDKDIREVGIGGAEFTFSVEDDLIDEQSKHSVSEYYTIIDKLQREVKLEFASYNSLLNTYNAKEDSIKHFPALHPVLDGRITSLMGMRYHPVYKIRKYHPGIDIAAESGTPIYASADGRVKLARYNGGYGNCVYIDHKYGYETRYGHMSKILVRQGQRVKRGDKIGLVGRTGVATAPHLHYEVLFNGKEVDPRHYFFNDFELNKLVVDNRR